MAYLLLYLPCLLLALCSLAFKRYALVFGLGSLFIAIAFAGLRGGGIDYGEYMLILKDVQQGQNLGWIDQAFLGKDFLFGLLASVLFSIGAGTQSVFFAAAALALSMKSYVFFRLYKNIAIPIFIYLLTYYILHEFIQIRVAIAISTCFVAAYYLVNRNPLVWLFFSVMAIGWHVSAFAFLLFSFPFIFSGKTRIFLMISAALSPFIAAHYADNFPNYFLERSEYIAKGFTLSVVLHYTTELVAFIYILVAGSALPHSKDTTNLRKEFILFSFYMMTIGFCMYAAFNSISGMIAYRYMEFFDAFSVILYLYLVPPLNSKFYSSVMFSRTLVLTTCVGYHLVYMLNADLYKEYVSSL